MKSQTTSNIQGKPAAYHNDTTPAHRTIQFLMASKLVDIATITAMLSKNHQSYADRFGMLLLPRYSTKTIQG